MTERATASQRLYVVVRADLSPGDQLAQACHAVAAYADDLPNRFSEWMRESGYLVVKAVPDEATLNEVAERVRKVGAVVLVAEPDLGTTLTALAAGPARAVYRALHGLPLALAQ